MERARRRSKRHGGRSGRPTFGRADPELGQLLGGARQTVNQVARALEHAGLVELHGRHVRIVDVEGLRLRAMSAGDAGD